MKRTDFVAAAIMSVAALTWTSAPVKAQMTAVASSTEIDVSALVGKWDGWWIGGESFPLEVTINADGTYVSRLGADSGWGTFRVANGVIFTEGHLSGAEAPLSDRMATVTLVQKNGVAMLMGDGRTSQGPYSFTLTKR